tara:strand:+ start:80262 stop:81437 length:1176 start_codon:yes stop_codon:yes gene_type:complete
VNLYEGVDEAFYSKSTFGTKNPIYAAFPVTSMIRHNRVDGLFIGYQEDKMGWNRSEFLGIESIDIHGMAGYSVAQQHFQYALGAEKSIGNERKWLLLGGQLHRTTTSEDYWRTGLYENSISSFATGFDYHDYYNAEGYGFYALLRPVRMLELGASYNEDRFSSVEMNTDFALISRYSSFRMNPAIDPNFDQIDQKSLNLGATINPFMLTRSFFSTTISAKAKLANMSPLNNDFAYNKWEVETKSTLRMDKSTVFKWRFMAGTITGEAPMFKQFALGGIGSMRAFGYKSMQGNQMLMSNFEMQFGKSSSHTNGWPNLSSTYLTLFLDSGSSSFNQNFVNTNNPVANFDIPMAELSHNAGVGLGLGAVRFEVAQPIIGSEGRTSFWIRLNPSF